MVRTLTIDDSKIWTEADYLQVDPANKTLEIYLLSQKDRNKPYLYLANSGTVISRTINTISFELADIFPQSS